MTQRDIIVFDLETTGTSITKDRIIQLAAVKVDHNLNIKEPIKCIMINPQGPIPAEATETHGITDDMVKDCPTFASYAKALFAFFDGCDLAGFNLMRFDVPLLAEEFGRLQQPIEWPDTSVNIIDAFKIFILKEKRDLAAAVKFYTGKELEGAHDAGNDVMGTLGVLKGQIERYEDLRDMDSKQLELFCREGKQRVDFEGNITIGKDGLPVYNLGKDKGKNIKMNPGFGQWMLKPENDFSSNTKKIIRQLIESQKKLWQ